MDSILLDLWNGKIFPAEKLAPNTSEFHSLTQIIGEETKYINGKLSADDNIRFEKFNEACDSLSEIYHIEAFNRGFRLALKIAVEVYSDKDGLPEIKKLLGIND